MDRTEKQRAFIIHFLYFVIVAGLVLIFLKYVIYEIMPFLIGFAIAFLLQPLIRALARKSGGHERLWAVLTVIVFYMTIGAGIAILFYQGAQFAADLFRQVPALYQEYIQPLLQTLSASLQEIISFLPFDDFSDVFAQLSASLDSVVSSVSSDLVSLLGQGRAPLEAAAAAAWLHGAAGDRCAAERGEYGMTPSDLIDAASRLLP